MEMVHATPGYLSEVFCSIQGEAALAGKPQLFLRFNYCNLDCIYCDTRSKIRPGRFIKIERTPGKMDFFNIPNPVTAQELFLHVKKSAGIAKACHSISLTGGEPLMQETFLAEFLPKLKKLRLPVMLETNGTLADELERVEKWIDFIAMDIKLPSAVHQKNLPEKHASFLKIAAQKKVFVKVIVNRKTTDAEFEEAIEITKRVSGRIPFYIQPATPVDIKTGRMFELYVKAAQKLHNVYVMPQMHPGRFY